MDKNSAEQPQKSPSLQRHEQPPVLTTIIRIAPASTSEKNDRRSVRCRSRRERPQKLILESKDQDSAGAEELIDGKMNVFEPDIESFVSNCIPGVSFAGDGEGWGGGQRRTKLIRKRSLPLLSFLSSTHLAAAEKKRKKEEQERQNSIAEEEAKKILLLNPINPTTGSLNADSIKAPNIESKGGVGLERDANFAHRMEAAGEYNSQAPEATPTVTTTLEKTSNILMPPLLKDFLNRLENCPR